MLPIDVFPMAGEDLMFDDPVKQRSMLERIIASSDQSVDLEDDDVVLNDRCVITNRTMKTKKRPVVLGFHSKFISRHTSSHFPLHCSASCFPVGSPIIVGLTRPRLITWMTRISRWLTVPLSGEVSLTVASVPCERQNCR